MIKWHEVIKAGFAGAPWSRLVEIAGSDAELHRMMDHARYRVNKFRSSDLSSPVWDFKYNKLLKDAMKELQMLENAYEKGE